MHLNDFYVLVVESNLMLRVFIFHRMDSMESILIKMLSKMKDDRSRSDDGDDAIKFPNFPEVMEEIELLPALPEIEQTEDSGDFKEVFEEMRR